MKKIKGRGILVLTLVVFLSYAVYDYVKEEKSETRKMEESRLMTVDFDQIDSLTIEHGSKLVLKRNVDGWKIEMPIQDGADNDETESFIKQMATDKILEVAKEGADIDWSLFGLDKPASVITVSTSAGKSNRLEISSKRNFEENTFLRRDGENRVLVVSSAIENKGNRGVLDFRDRRFLRHKIGSLQSLNLKNAKGVLKIEQKDGKWIASDKKDLKLDQNKVRETLQAIADARAADYVGNGESIPKASTLFSMDLVLKDRSWKAQVTQAADKVIYAKVSDPEFHLKMEPGSLDRFINLTLEDLKETPAQPNQLDKKDK